MFDFSLFGSFLMDASNLLQFGQTVADLAVDDDTRSRGGGQRRMDLPTDERREREQQLRVMRQSQKRSSREQSR